MLSAKGSPRPRPIVEGVEQRWRWWIMRVDEERRRYVYFHDVERFDEAALFVDVAISLCESEFVVFDSVDRCVVHDSRKVRAKLAGGA